MATYAERFKIVRDAQLRPEAYADDAALQLEYPDTTLAEVNAARSLLRRVQAALIDVANDQLGLAPGPDNNSAILWAQAVTQSPGNEAVRALQILLARFDAMTPVQVLDPGVATDEALLTGITALVPQLSLGYPRR